MANYKLTEEADGDLERLFDYGIDQFGLEQARSYFEEMKHQFFEIAENPHLWQAVDYIHSEFPQAVMCLISALSFHRLTTQIPHEISIAIKRGARSPTLDHPPINVYQFSAASFDAGIESHIIDSVSMKIYSPEKTLVDCFKFRNKIGMDVAIEALQLYKAQQKFKLNEILHYADTCRIQSVIKPYLKALI